MDSLCNTACSSLSDCRYFQFTAIFNACVIYRGGAFDESLRIVAVPLLEFLVVLSRAMLSIFAYLLISKNIG